MSRYFSGVENAFFDSCIHGNNIPSDAVLISDDEYFQLFAELRHGKHIVPDINGRPIAVIPDIPTEQIFKEKNSEIDAVYEQAMALLSAGYPRAEVDGWPDQARALDIFDANPEAANTVLDGLAESNGISRSEMARRIREKRERYLHAYARLTGLKQVLQRELSAINQDDANAKEQIEAIDTTRLVALETRASAPQEIPGASVADGEVPAASH